MKAADQGAQIIPVHDVFETVQALTPRIWLLFLRSPKFFGVFQVTAPGQEASAMSNRNIIFVLALLAMLVGCSAPHPGVHAAIGQLIRYDHSEIGAVVVEDEQSGSRIRIEAFGLPPGAHGVHLHSIGSCDGRRFTAAGPHWNPTHRQHGHDNPAGYHAGDLGNIMVGPNGTISTQMIATDVRLLAAPGGRGAVISDRDGATLIIHALPDDERTDPGGNSGEPIACAVVAAHIR